LEELSESADNINSTLEKQLYAGTAEQQSKLANKLYSEASAAKAAMAQLPTEELSLENTYKFLSQVGSYAKSIAEKSADGEEISDDEYDNLKLLHEYSQNLSDDMWALEESVSSGEIDINKISDNYISGGYSSSFDDGFSDFEESFEEYPTLIYDGPFSDHIMKKTPIMTQNAEKISYDKALERASMALGISSVDLVNVIEESGKMPSWIFSDKDESVSCAVTKQGGFISYFIKSRQPTSAAISVEDAVDKAENFIYDSGYSNMKVTYYEREGNVVTVNFAYYIDEITCYTDLMKVSVAMDDGEILGFEASGYIVNHQKRVFPTDTISILECEKKLSPLLTCESKSKVLIPSDGENEIYCYEYLCKTEDDREVLVYINAVTGKEEKILILLKNESGTLTI
jgi:germination protein YpeB